MKTFRIVEGDVLARLPELEPASFDACFCDPPYHLGDARPANSATPRASSRAAARGFMGQAWDGGDVAFRAETWAAVMRVLKPGGFLLAFGGSRTYHRLACAVEDAGLELRDCIMWLYGEGFPKSLDISKAIDKAAGAENIVGSKPDRWTGKGTSLNFATDRPQAECKVTAPATPDAVRWAGYGTALKPAYEPIIVAMKPLDGTFAANALKWGVAGINVDAGRIGLDGIECHRTHSRRKPSTVYAGGFTDDDGTKEIPRYNAAGRWPANVILDEEAARLLDMQSGESCYPRHDTKRSGTREIEGQQYCGGYAGQDRVVVGYGDSGGASRFFYVAKADNAERNIGGIKNTHPTVKPVDLCAYLARLILPPERDTPRRLIVPFSGSGSEIMGAMRAGWDESIGIEGSPEYAALARRRIEGDAPMFNAEAAAPAEDFPGKRALMQSLLAGLGEMV